MNHPKMVFSLSVSVMISSWAQSDSRGAQTKAEKAGEYSRPNVQRCHFRVDGVRARRQAQRCQIG